MSATVPGVCSARLLDGWGAPELSPDRWAALMARGATRTIFQTRTWLETWWTAFGRGRLLLVLGCRDGGPAALAPLFVDEGMAFPVGSGGSDYLDVIGEGHDPALLRCMLDAVREAVPDLLGVRLYLVPDDSGTGRALQAVAAEGAWACHDEGELAAPWLDLDLAGEQAIQKKSLVRHERFFRREGNLAVLHYEDPPVILARFDAFFDQHVRRWAGTPYPSLFLDLKQREFYRRLVENAGPEGWLRFTEVSWDGAPIAFHLGFLREGRFLWYKPSFDVDLARRSPGEVLLRQLLRAAMGEGAREFDLGLGDEPFKRRFATGVRWVRTWGLYPA